MQTTAETELPPMEDQENSVPWHAIAGFIAKQSCTHQHGDRTTPSYFGNKRWVVTGNKAVHGRESFYKYRRHLWP
jgi:hypothetical protein